MKIIHVISRHSPIQGGPYTVALNLANSMGKRGHEVYILTQSNQIKHIKFIKFDFYSENILPAVLLIKRLNPSTMVPIRGLVRSLKLIRSADVLHIHLGREFFTMFFALFSIILRKRYVIQSHGMIVKDSRLLAKCIDVFALKIIYRFTKDILCLTEREMERSPFKCAKMRLFPNGIEIHRKRERELEKANEIVFLGRINHVKQLELWTRHVSSLNQLNPRTLPSKIYGFDDGGLSELRSRMSKNPDPKISYAGGINDAGTVRQILSSSKVLFMTSKYENFPMAVVEAMSMGTPVLIFAHFDISPIVSKAFPEMVIWQDAEGEIPSRLKKLASLSCDDRYVARIIEFAKREFSIENLCKLLELEIYP